MAEKTELETETEQSPREAAEMLRSIADDAGANDFVAFCEWLDRNS